MWLKNFNFAYSEPTESFCYKLSRHKVDCSVWLVPLSLISNFARKASVPPPSLIESCISSLYLDRQSLNASLVKLNACRECDPRPAFIVILIPSAAVASAAVNRGKDVPSPCAGSLHKSLHAVRDGERE